MTGKVTKYCDVSKNLTISCIQIEHEVIFKMNIFMYHGLTKIIPCGLVHPDLKVLGFLPVILSC